MAFSTSSYSRGDSSVAPKIDRNSSAEKSGPLAARASSVSLPTRFLKIHRPWRSIEHSVTEKRYNSRAKRQLADNTAKESAVCANKQGPSLVMVYLQVSF